MRRSGPLQELPLEQFLPTSSKVRPNKRPLSPGAPNLFSPTKRRLLEEEGIFTPEKTTKSPFFASRGATPSYFSAVLCGPESPARKLDFSPSKRTNQEGSSKVTKEEAPSYTSPSVATTSTIIAAEASSDSNHLSATPFEEFSDDESSDFEFDSSAVLGQSRAPNMIPREMPPPPDPQSQHYPGFSIYQDTHILIPRASENKTPPSQEDESTKENIAPRRKLKKSATVPLSPSSVSMKNLDLSGPSKARSTPVTPKPAAFLRPRPPSPTPRRPIVGLHPASALTPMANPSARRELRRMLEREADTADSEDEEEHEL
ncbi:hypothetical protein PC9H_004867 [Pleurotus ostreatus]|uniref:Uncharacterized protein n=1 Tax=Pleurotus ostreatus TaxID=5322 RepID=A0A8H7DWI0_PLEOS|nr:uncharacterized protein PC9H_004867 [Pleurotus ostreatus]KAF7432923.1 hypothetical protein PC9H_004867 [Pleurotus ostreatus]KAJ8698495.1 hypothetical protein PTI98_005200 [Pleurotus ostreatus]